MGGGGGGGGSVCDLVSICYPLAKPFLFYGKMERKEMEGEFFMKGQNILNFLDQNSFLTNKYRYLLFSGPELIFLKKKDSLPPPPPKKEY